jgi:hypothetical protein
MVKEDGCAVGMLMHMYMFENVHMMLLLQGECRGVGVRTVLRLPHRLLAFFME